MSATTLPLPQRTERLWPDPLDLEALAEREPEAPKFVLRDWLPCGYATLLAGHGGVGKSGIALYIAICISAGLPFFGIPVERRRVLYLSCEDRKGVLHWRLTRICAHLSIDLASLRGWLEVIDLVGKDTVLCERDPRTGSTVTPAFGELERRMREHETQVLVIDGTSDTFGGNENSRSEVKRYVSALIGLVSAKDGAVLLVGHVNRQTASAGQTSEGYSGSTAWHNSVRARWYLYPESREGDEDERGERTGDLLLKLQKSNFGPVEQSMRFAWDEQAHIFVGKAIVGATAADRAHRGELEREALLAALRASVAAEVTVPAATSGRRTAFNVLSVRPEFPESLRAGTAGRRRFWCEIERLRQMGALREENYRRDNRHYGTKLVPASEGVRQCV